MTTIDQAYSQGVRDFESGHHSNPFDHETQRELASAWAMGYNARKACTAITIDHDPAYSPPDDPDWTLAMEDLRSTAAKRGYTPNWARQILARAQRQRWRPADEPPPVLKPKSPKEAIHSQFVLCSCSRPVRIGQPPRRWYEIARYWPNLPSGEPAWFRTDGVEITSWVTAWQYPDEHPTTPIDPTMTTTTTHTTGTLSTKPGYNGTSQLIADNVGENLPLAIMIENAGIARRLAACWNACDGISTDVLELNATAGGVATLERQRDAMRAALQAYASAFAQLQAHTAASPLRNIWGHPVDLSPLEAAHAQAQEALK